MELPTCATLKEGVLSVQLDPDALARVIYVDPASLNGKMLGFDVRFTHRRRGVDTRLVLAGTAAKTDDTLIANMDRAHDWIGRLKRGEPLDDIARAE